MKVKLSELLDIGRILISWAQSKTFSGKVAYKITRMINVIKPYAEDFEQQRNVLIKRLGKQIEESEHYSIPDEDIEANKEFGVEIKSLLESEIEITFPAGIISPEDITFEISLPEMEVLSKIME